MANAGKPTPRTRHINVRYFAICDWVERDLVILERVDTPQNLADNFTKPLSCILFYLLPLRKFVVTYPHGNTVSILTLLVACSKQVQSH